MKKTLFSAHIQPACAYCTVGRPASDGEKILCPHRGIVDPGYGCARFRYNPLNRVPRRAPRMQSFTKEDFEL
jgi:hypothetical protein